ncbi:hypothetical protein FEM48_Zijuj09G0136100 [Ziziphus jujuba var. spinosa]|uniref:GH10 domain-containing protein n=1 Tax=Ziziphus jujuba var. spinosa TaxID=714518 RepID=A0A978UTB3_ZIZJJ|nr:hypothetical protein FEM48_Zijuj09G0136100 [Ziziphus jujuba var. spinosa]
MFVDAAWIQVSKGNVPVTAVFKTNTGFIHAGAIVAESHCWSFLKGGVTVNASGSAELYFESKDTSVEIWVDSISLQPFTEQQWRSHQDQSIEKAHKRNVKIKVVDAKGNPLPNATISIQQKQSSFPFGCAINKNILNNNAYKNWFTSRRFTVTTFENEMKWYSNEPYQGKEDYSVSDAMLQFTKQHGISVRGHNILWDDPQYQPFWVKSLSGQQLSSAASKRLNSIMSRYKGQVIAWDVVNENLHHNFFESKIGNTASSVFYNLASKADGTTTLFLNEYNTIEEPGEKSSTPAKYLAKLREIKSFPGNGNIRLGIGLESHFTTPPNLPYIRSSIDTLAATGFPIWLTEVDAAYLEQILREGRSHPKVQGIVIWAAWSPQGCYQMCLTDNNFKNLPTGDVVDKLLREWGLEEINGKIDGHGFYKTSLFHGDYQVKVSHPTLNNSFLSQSLSVASQVDDESHHTTILFQVSA